MYGCPHTISTAYFIKKNQLGYLSGESGEGIESNFQGLGSVISLLSYGLGTIKSYLTHVHTRGRVRKHTSLYAALSSGNYGQHLAMHFLRELLASTWPLYRLFLNPGFIASRGLGSNFTPDHISENPLRGPAVPLSPQTGGSHC